MAAVAATSFSVKNNVGFNISPDTSRDDGKPRFKVGIITLPATADNADTAAVDIFANFGMIRFMGIHGYTQSTTNSVIITEAPTTVVQGTTLTITVGGSTANKARTFVIYGI